jgi:hypothetical protein
VSVAIALQPELITNDPRLDAESSGIIEDLREFVRASRELRGLLTTGQAAQILGVAPGAVRTWVLRKRLSSVRILGVVMVSAAEVLALHRQRVAEGVSSGGRGHKAPSLAVLAEAAWADIEPME